MNRKKDKSRVFFFFSGPCVCVILNFNYLGKNMLHKGLFVKYN